MSVKVDVPDTVGPTVVLILREQKIVLPPVTKPTNNSFQLQDKFDNIRQDIYYVIMQFVKSWDYTQCSFSSHETLPNSNMQKHEGYVRNEEIILILQSTEFLEFNSADSPE